MSQTDAIVIGAGHNGLVAACVLARAGLRVIVLERRDVTGGACITEELTPGFRVSSAAYSFSLFRPEIASSLELEKFGLFSYPKEPRMFVPLLDGRHFFVWRDAERTRQEIARIDEHDADAYTRFSAFWDDVAAKVRPMMVVTEPPSLEDVERALGAEMYRLAVAGSAADTVEYFFRSDEIRGATVGQGVIGAFAGPRTPGTAFVMTYHAFGGEMVDGAATWAYVRGGMGGVTQALEARARAAGVEIRTGADVDQIVVEGQRAVGVSLSGGTIIEARAVLSNADPKRTFLSMTPSGALPAEFVARAKNFDTTGSVVKVNLALNELPSFTALPGTDVGPQHSGTIEISPSIDSLERAFSEAQSGHMSSEPFMEVYIQSATDDSLAPPGKHVASCFAQWAPGDAPVDPDVAGDAVVGTLARYAPNLPGAIIHREVLTPAELEHRFGLTGGNIFHGEILPGQIFGERFGARTPLDGLYLCGSGAHPGGGVSGAPGWNAARALLEDLGR